MAPCHRIARLALGETLEEFLARERLFSVDDAGIARLPLLIRGQLTLSELPPRDVIEIALASGEREIDIGATQLIAVDSRIEKLGLRCLALPRVTDPTALVPGERADRIRTLHPLRFAQIAEHLDAIGAAMGLDSPIIRRALPLAISSSDQPEHFVRLGFADVHAAFNGSAVGLAVDRELSYGGRPGRQFLDGWVELDDEIEPGAMAIARAALDASPSPRPARRRVRAIPTTQLHITAGNSPVVPAISTLRALATKGAATVKLPSGALVAGAAFALALWSAGPEHPLIRHASIAYWRGGDARVEGTLFRLGAFERIVVWGSRASVDAVASRAAGTKTLLFNPRYGVSLIGREALAAHRIEETARRAAQDSMIWNQQACIASLVHYVEGSGEAVDRYCRRLAEELSVWDTAHAHRPDRAAIGRMRAARRGEWSEREWLVNGPPVAPSSGVVRIDHEFDLSAHPQARIVVVRAVGDLADTLELMHSGVSSVGVAPDERVEEFRDRICGRGVTSVLPLGEADTLFLGAPHDGNRALSELVSWSVS